jgi:DNA topoisomerase I
MALVPVPELRYTSDEEPGYRRRRAGRGFVYIGPDGAAVRDEAMRERFRALAVPPAWTDVWLCPDARGHLQASGRDARGRKQYRYHPEWRAFRDRVKFEHLVDFGRALPRIRRRIRKDLADGGVDRAAVLALVVSILERSLVRVGNEEYARANGSYGLTTLRNKHASVRGDRITLVFRGKGGSQHRATVRDRRLASAVRRCLELPGQHLFQYLTSDGEACAIGSGDVNDYLREAAGIDVTAKDFRTWVATLLSGCAFASLEPPISKRASRDAVSTVMTEVSAALGNTPTVCRASYVHPGVVAAFEDGSWPQRWVEATTTKPRGLLADERRLLGALRSLRRAPPKEAGVARRTDRADASFSSTDAVGSDAA